MSKASDMRRMAIKRLALAATLGDVLGWYQAQLADQPSPVEWAEMMEALTPSDRAKLDEVAKRMITDEEVGELRAIVRELGHHTTRLYVGDRHVMWEVRCGVMDALDELNEGHLAVAYGLMSRANGRLNWMLYERKRDGYEVKRMLPPDVVPSLKRLHRRMVDSLAFMGRAAASASI